MPQGNSMHIKQIVLTERPKGEPSIANFRLDQISVPILQEGELLIKVIWLSLDPYMRGRMDGAQSYAQPVSVGDPMQGECIGEVIQSKNERFIIGEFVAGGLGWVSHSISNGDNLRKIPRSNIPIQASLGVLGMPGHTAWVGLNKIASASSGETIVVSAASGAVGSLVGQLAKRKGLRVIGVAGSEEKCAHVTKELGYDGCINHKTVSSTMEFREIIRKHCPDGIDIYFENVAGITLESVLPNMNNFGRIAVCGMISWYSGKGVQDSMAFPKFWRTVLVKRLMAKGFIIFDHKASFNEFWEEVSPLVASGNIKYKEDIRQGLESAPESFLSLLNGGNFGKMLVRL